MCVCVRAWGGGGGGGGGGGVTLRLEENGRHSAVDIFKCIFLHKVFVIVIDI